MPAFENSPTFKYGLGQPVHLVLSREFGRVRGYARITSGDDQYLVLYRAADGRQAEDWLTESVIAPGHPDGDPLSPAPPVPGQLPGYRHDLARDPARGAWVGDPTY